MRHFLPQESLQAILDSFAAIGLDAGSIETAFRGQEDTHSRSWGVIAGVEELMCLWKEARKQSGQAHLFVRAGLSSEPGSFGLIDGLVYASETFEEGLKLLQRYISLISSTTVVEFEEGEEEIKVLFYNRPWFPIHNYVDPWLLGLFARRLREGLGEDVPVVSMSLRTLKTEDEELNRLLGTRVFPHPNRSGITIPREVWERPLPGASADVKASLLVAAEELKLQRFAASPLSYAVWNTIAEVVDSRENLSKAVSGQLGISVRTLQRRLLKENFTLSDLLESYRKQEAFRLLSEGLNSISEISSSLGYTEQSSFNRAFKRWVGTSPTRWYQHFSKRS